MATDGLREALEKLLDATENQPDRRPRDKYGPIGRAHVPAIRAETLRALLAAHPVEPTTAEQVVADFIAQREEYIRVLKQTVNANHDYYRWQGHAEARRQLRDKLAALSAEAVQS